MKICVAARVLDEERNIERFIKNHSFADVIFLADGGSTDRTIEIASKYDKVIIKNFTEKTEFILDGVKYYQNNENKHFNWLVNETNQLDVSWIIYDDVDSYPNYLLQKDIRSLLESTDKIQVRPLRLYLYKDEGYFPDLNKSGQTSLWAWRKGTNVYAKEDKGNNMEYGGVDENALMLDFPYCLLHNSFQTDEDIEFKMKRYEAVAHKLYHPLTWGGELLPLPEWAHE